MQKAEHNTQILTEVITLSLNKGLPLFAYRLPNSTNIEFGVETTPKPNYKFGDKGFIFAPYSSDEYPAIFIHNDINITTPNLLEELKRLPQRSVTDVSTPNRAITKEEYKSSVADIIAAIERGEIDKAVFSRTVNYDVDLNIADCFIALTQKYPNAYIFLVSAPNQTLWMGATPELLMQVEGDKIETMSLAATIKADGTEQWSDKEYTEQNIVTNYIVEQFNAVGISPTLSPLHDYYAGAIKHLCNRVSAVESNSAKVLNLIEHLHPTPAVCGVPKCEAQNILAMCEKRSRRYYAGYLGYIDSSKRYTLFVNLRSMEIFPNRVQLYVGGGITAASNIEQEWRETENKAATLLNCIN